MEAVKTRMQRIIETLPAGQQEKMEALNRRGKRSRLRIRHGAGGMFSRVLSGTPTGTTPHFKMWMADLNIKRTLQRTRLTSLASSNADPFLATAYSMLSDGGFKSVWDLTQANAQQILAVKGIGPKRLAELKADLAKHQVAVNW